METIAEEIRTKYLEQITKEIKSLRGWLDYLERDLTAANRVIPAILLTSIAESCTSIVYSAGVVNGEMMSRE
jgi:hypothetical protein